MKRPKAIQSEERKMNSSDQPKRRGLKGQSLKANCAEGKTAYERTVRSKGVKIEIEKMTTTVQRKKNKREGKPK